MFVYIFGVISGSLATSVFDHTVFLAGASGGIYALVTGNISFTNYSIPDRPQSYTECFTYLLKPDYYHLIPEIKSLKDE